MNNEMLKIKMDLDELIKNKFGGNKLNFYNQHANNLCQYIYPSNEDKEKEVKLLVIWFNCYFEELTDLEIIEILFSNHYIFGELLFNKIDNPSIVLSEKYKRVLVYYTLISKTTEKIQIELITKISEIENKLEKLKLELDMTNSRLNEQDFDNITNKFYTLQGDVFSLKEEFNSHKAGMQK